MDTNSPDNNPEVKKQSPLRKLIKIIFGNSLREAAVFWLDVALNIVIIVAFVFIIRTYLISPFQVFGPSMCNTFNYFDEKCQNTYGEYLIVNKFGYQNFLGWQVGLPRRGDIIVFHPPHNANEFYIKRVIGLSGETVKLANGKVYIVNKDNPDGFELNEPYLNGENRENTNPFVANKTIFEVPNDEYFVLGDNRLHSTDSRACFKESIGGPTCGSSDTAYLTLDHIEGKAWLVLWPLNKLNILADPTYN